MLDLSKEEMRALGYRAIDSVIEHLETLDRKPVAQSATSEFVASLQTSAPRMPSETMDLIDELEATVFSQTIHVDHPRFFAFVPGPGNFVGVIAQLLAAGHNTFCGSWLAGSAAIEMELQTLRWLAELCGLPSSWSGLTTSGGSISNLIGLATARTVNDYHSESHVAYYSDQTHYSISRALKVIGFGESQLREVDSVSGRLDLGQLKQLIDADVAQGRKPAILIANAGTTNTGAIDPIAQLAELAQQHEMWLHIDAAYGGPAAVTKQGKILAEQLQLGHSLTLDPHKWLFQPFDCGCVLVKDPGWLEQTFRAAPAYLQDVHGMREVHMCDRGIELTRPFRALGLWMTVQAFGMDRIEEAIQYGIDQAEFVESLLKEQAETWEILSPAQLGILCFRYRREGLDEATLESLHQALVPELMKDGYTMYSRTTIEGKTVCRLCTINPRTTEDDLRCTLAKIQSVAERWVGNQ